MGVRDLYDHRGTLTLLSDTLATRPVKTVSFHSKTPDPGTDTNIPVSTQGSQVVHGPCVIRELFTIDSFVVFYTYLPPRVTTS